MFLTNPSPICVLDEVDAPLDDANVERFCRLLDEMARETDTRFIVITHHPHHHGAHGPAVRRHDGRARRQPARLGRPRSGRALARRELDPLITRHCDRHAGPKCRASTNLMSSFRRTPEFRVTSAERVILDTGFRRMTWMAGTSPAMTQAGINWGGILDNSVITLPGERLEGRGLGAMLRLIAALLALACAQPAMSQEILGQAGGIARHGNVDRSDNQGGGHAIDQQDDAGAAEEAGAAADGPCTLGEGLAGLPDYLACKAGLLDLFSNVARALTLLSGLLAASLLLMWFYLHCASSAARKAASYIPTAERAYAFGGPDRPRPLAEPAERQARHGELRQDPCFAKRVARGLHAG